MMGPSSSARAVLDGFLLGGAVSSVEPFGRGHIHDSFAVSIEGRGPSPSFLLQRVNTTVFPDVPALMANIAAVASHLAAKIASEGGDPLRETPTLVPAAGGAPFLRDGRGGWWRAFVFIEGTVSRDAPATDAETALGARAVGVFQRRLADLDPGALAETIPGFHDPIGRYAKLIETARADPSTRLAGASAELRFIEARTADLERWDSLVQRGTVKKRIVHNDTKFNNILFDLRTGEPRCLVDLDTVMPGVSILDFADYARTAACAAAEDETDLGRVKLDRGRYRAAEAGYLGACGEMLSPGERGELPFAARVIALEQAIRFLDDHLAGDRYYKIARPGHNLDRCRTQLALAASIGETGL